MSVTAYGLCGFALMLSITLFLVWGKMSPVVGLTIIPLIFGLAIGATPVELGAWALKGMQSQVSTAAMFIFAVIFFSCMMDTGVFDVIISKLLGRAKSVRLVCFLTVVATIVGHMDGSGPTTFLLVVPPLLVIYNSMKMRPIVLVCLVTITAGTMNMLPWAGNAGRIAAGMGLTAAEVFTTALPGWIIALLCCVLMSQFFASREIKRGAGAPEGMNLRDMIEQSLSSDPKKQELRRPKMFWINLMLIVVTMWSVFAFPKVPLYLIFAVAGDIALMLNYPGAKAQAARIQAYAPTVMTLVAVVFASGIDVGILNNSPMLKSMSSLIKDLVSGSVSRHLNTFMAYLWAPLSTIGLGHTSTCNGILPVIHTICAENFSKLQVGASYLMNFSPRVYVSATTPAMYIALGLAGIDLKDHMRFSLGWGIGICWVAFTGCLLLGVIPA